MRNEFLGWCRSCNRLLQQGEGELMSIRHRLVLYCPEHQEEAYSQAQRFLFTSPPGEPPHDRDFPDGSAAHWNGERWLVMR